MTHSACDDELGELRGDVVESVEPIARGGAWAEIGDLPLESGVLLPGIRLFYESFGTLAPDAGNAVFVFHGLAADSHLARISADDAPGWWEGVVGAGLGLDTDRLCVIAANILGGCAGSTGPTSLAPDGEEWASRFPSLTIRDQVAAAVRLGAALGIERWKAVVGVSYGGMHALEWHVGHPGTAERVAVIAGPWATTAEQIAANALQTRIVRADPAFHDGFYRSRGAQPRTGLALARQVGMLQYRGPGEFDRRFGRTTQDPAGEVFAVESYFAGNAERFAASFDANSFITLVESKNSHDIGRGRGGAEHALASATAPLLVAGIDSDRLYPIEQQRFIAEHSPGSASGHVPLTLASEHGHDAFLIDQNWFGEALASFVG